MSSVDYLELGRDLTRAHAEHLAAGRDVTVESVLIDARRCPSCAGPLICGDKIALCVECGSEVDRDA